MHLKKFIDFLNTNMGAKTYVNTADLILSDLQTNSKYINTNDVFIALPGKTHYGTNFINDAIVSGAKLIITDINYNNPSINYAVVENLANKLPTIANFFYNYPSHKLKIAGITGTNGKTTTAYLLQQLLATVSNCGFIGTIGIGNNYKNLKTNQYTTPDLCSLQKYLASFIKQKATFCSMEVSSHAIHQERIKNTKFALGVFTNLGIDHLDYHQNIASYWQTKASFFNDYTLQNMLFNADCPYGRLLATRYPNSYVYSLYYREDFKNRLIWTQITTRDPLHNKLDIFSPWGKYSIEQQIIGYFNISNLLAAISSAFILTAGNFNLENIPQLTMPKGRMQIINNKPLVIVDYAHTADALQVCLINLRNTKKKIWCVFGCGGDRCQVKRSPMLTTACSLSDQVIITQDNSRNEDPKSIIAQMLLNNEHFSNYKIILDRKSAIEYAIHNAKADDIIFIAGKGHEEYQIINNTSVFFSDQETALNALHPEKCK